MSARHVDETIPMLARSDDPYQSNERVRAELMQLTGYFHTESSHHASEYWAWFRKTPELTRHYLDRHWDNLEVSAAAAKARSDQYIVDEARREGIQHGGDFAAPIIDSIVTGTAPVVYLAPAQRRPDHQPPRGRVRRAGLRCAHRRREAGPVRRPADRAGGAQRGPDH